MQKIAWRTVFIVLVVAGSTLGGPAIGNAVAGELNCGEALVCLLTCDAGDAQCAFDCGQGLQPQAEEKYAELMMCLVPVCPGNPPDAVCLMQAAAGPCEAEHKACVDDSGCTPNCDNKECGDNGCGGDCGSCPPGMGCDESFVCQVCEPDCGGKSCGEDGCGGSCGECGGGQSCVDFQCVSCEPDCIGKECGDDGCGGQCGQCGFSSDCVNGMCQGCTPNCAGKECGDNGCGGMCGACPPEYKCETGVCVEDIPCDANCLNKECGDDGCGGDCGSCGIEQYCSPSGICLSGEEPEIVEEPDTGGEQPDDDVGNQPGSGDATSSGQDTGSPRGNVEPVNGQCPEGYKYWFGQCEKEEDEGGGGGGCSTSPRPDGFSLLLLLILLLGSLRIARPV